MGRFTDGRGVIKSSQPGLGEDRLKMKPASGANRNEKLGPRGEQSETRNVDFSIKAIKSKGVAN